MASVQLGQRVVRSPTWTWRDQDGGDGHVGTVVKLGSNNPEDAVGTPLGWVKIRWDNGYTNNYQAGSKNNYDMLLFDNAPAGLFVCLFACLFVDCEFNFQRIKIYLNLNKLLPLLCFVTFLLLDLRKASKLTGWSNGYSAHQPSWANLVAILARHKKRCHFFGSYIS